MNTVKHIPTPMINEQQRKPPCSVQEVEAIMSEMDKTNNTTFKTWIKSEDNIGKKKHKKSSSTRISLHL